MKEIFHSKRRDLFALLYSPERKKKSVIFLGLPIWFGFSRNQSVSVRVFLYLIFFSLPRRASDIICWAIVVWFHFIVFLHILNIVGVQSTRAQSCALAPRNWTFFFKIKFIRIQIAERMNVSQWIRCMHAHIDTVNVHCTLFLRLIFFFQPVLFMIFLRYPTAFTIIITIMFEMCVIL